MTTTQTNEAVSDATAEVSGPWLCDCGRWTTLDPHLRSCERWCWRHAVEVDPARGCSDCYADDRALGLA